MADTENQVINEKLIEDVKNAIKDKDQRTLSHLIGDKRPADTADLVEQLNPDERLYLFNILEPEGAG